MPIEKISSSAYAFAKHAPDGNAKAPDLTFGRAVDVASSNKRSYSVASRSASNPNEAKNNSAGWSRSKAAVDGDPRTQAQQFLTLFGGGAGAAIGGGLGNFFSAGWGPTGSSSHTAIYPFIGVTRPYTSPNNYDVQIGSTLGLAAAGGLLGAGLAYMASNKIIDAGEQIYNYFRGAQVPNPSVHESIPMRDIPSISASITGNPYIV